MVFGWEIFAGTGGYCGFLEWAEIGFILKGISWLQDSQTSAGCWYRFWRFWLSEVGLMFENYLNKSDRGKGLLTELLTWVWLNAGKEMCMSKKNTTNMFQESLEKVLIYITDLHNTFTRSTTDFA
ncbi:hypothetical protein C5167_048106 [Papaver somniferum]|uniref:Uncharacterized protein n=1 Tax=Papaver somniferum TaxID=3469 RepID=A0A4Y7KGZ3_PAPSO|nr:hypothetical protein C5167_048106 [Papaver somniferum]